MHALELLILTLLKPRQELLTQVKERLAYVGAVHPLRLLVLRGSRGPLSRGKSRRCSFKETQGDNHGGQVLEVVVVCSFGEFTCVHEYTDESHNRVANDFLPSFYRRDWLSVGLVNSSQVTSYMCTHSI